MHTCVVVNVATSARARRRERPDALCPSNCSDMMRACRSVWGWLCMHACMHGAHAEGRHIPLHGMRSPHCRCMHACRGQHIRRWTSPRNTYPEVRRYVLNGGFLVEQAIVGCPVHSQRRAFSTESSVLPCHEPLDSSPSALDVSLCCPALHPIQRKVTPPNANPCSRCVQGRSAYLQWREGLKRMHASTVVDIMRRAGYEDAPRAHVERIILKRALREPEGQVVEDALCLGKPTGGRRAGRASGHACM